MNLSKLKGFWEDWPDSYPMLYDYLLEQSEGQQEDPKVKALYFMKGREPYHYQDGEIDSWDWDGFDNHHEYSSKDDVLDLGEVDPYHKSKYQALHCYWNYLRRYFTFKED